MKSFLKSLFYFFAAFILLLMLIYVIGKYSIETISYYKLPDNTKYIVFGHSHSECAYNDSLIENLLNFSNVWWIIFLYIFKS